RHARKAAPGDALWRSREEGCAGDVEKRREARAGAGLDLVRKKSDVGRFDRPSARSKQNSSATNPVRARQRPAAVARDRADAIEVLTRRAARRRAAARAARAARAAA